MNSLESAQFSERADGQREVPVARSPWRGANRPMDEALGDLSNVSIDCEASSPWNHG